MPSDITTKLSPDKPVTLSSSYQLDSKDRRKIDDQIVGVQTHLAESVIRGQQRSYFKLDPSSVSLAKGDVFCVSSSSTSDESDAANAVRVVTRATDAALLSAGVIAGIAATAAAPGTTFQGVVDGIVGPGITGLGAVAGAVRVNSARCQRVASLTGSDYAVGFVDPAGNLTISKNAAGAAVGGGAALTNTIPSAVAAPQVGVSTEAMRADASFGTAIATGSAGERHGFLHKDDKAKLDTVQSGATLGIALQDTSAVTQAARALARVRGAYVADNSGGSRTDVDLDRDDIRAFGGNGTYTGSQSTGSCTTGGALTLTGANAVYKRGNWLLLHGAGAAHGMATPSAPTVIAQNATGARTVSVRIVAVTASWGFTAASPATVIANANATISKTNFVEVFCPPIAGARWFLVYAQFGGSGGTHNLIGACVANPDGDNFGQIWPAVFRIESETTQLAPAGLPSDPAAAVSTPNAWRTQIQSGAGTANLTVSPVPITATTSKVVEICNLIPIENAMRSVTVNGAELRIGANATNEGYHVTGDIAVYRDMLFSGSNGGNQQSSSVLKMKDGVQFSVRNGNTACAWSPGRQTRVGDRVAYINRGANPIRIFECTAVPGGTGWATTGGTEPAWNTTPGGTTNDNGITWTTGFVTEASAHGVVLEHFRLDWVGHALPCGRHIADDDARLGAEERLLGNFAGSHWVAGGGYALGAFILPTVANANGKIYEATAVAGVAGGSEPAWPKTIGATVVDGGITWTCRDCKRVQGAALLMATVFRLYDMSINGPYGTGLFVDGSSYGSGGAVNVSSGYGVAIQNIHGGHGMVVQGPDGNVCRFDLFTFGVAQADSGSCFYQDMSNYGAHLSNANCDGNWRAQNRKVNTVQAMAILDNVYIEGTSNADTDWYKPGQIYGGLHAAGLRAGATAHLTDFCGTDPSRVYSTMRLELDSTGTLEKREAAGELYLETVGGSSVARTFGRLMEKWDATARCWKKYLVNVNSSGSVNSTANYLTIPQYSHKGNGIPWYPGGLYVGDNGLGKVAATYQAPPSSGVFLAGDVVLWAAEGGAVPVPRLAMVATQRGVLGAAGRANSTSYLEGTAFTSSGKTFVVVVGGVTASSPPAGLAAAGFDAYVTDGTCVVQCFNSTTSDPGMRALPVRNASVALADADATIQITSGNNRRTVAATANRTIRLGNASAGGSGMQVGDHWWIVVPQSTAFTWTIVDDSTSATLGVFAAGTAFQSMLFMATPALVWERQE